MSDEVLEKFDDFKQGTCNWIEMTIESEVIKLVTATQVDLGSSLTELVNRHNARYCIP